MVAAEARSRNETLSARPPTARTTAVCKVPPPAGMAPKKAPDRLAAPMREVPVRLIGGSDDSKRSAGGNRFRKAHQRDLEGPGE